jgi:hypothetical protein
VALPDPIVSNVTGGVLIAAGLVQEGIRRRILHVDDVLKTFQNMMRELRSAKEQV